MFALFILPSIVSYPSHAQSKFMDYFSTTIIVKYTYEQFNI